MNLEVTDPEHCTIYDRSDPQLEEFLLFCIAVAGKNARSTRRALQKFWSSIPFHQHYPFHVLKLLHSPECISRRLKESGVGCHRLKGMAFWIASHSDLDLRRCSSSALEQIKGIGRKTSRFFLLHSRRRARCAILDVHILRHMRSLGIDAPESTPKSAKEYARLEQVFLGLVPPGMSPAAFDLKLWNHYSKKGLSSEFSAVR